MPDLAPDPALAHPAAPLLALRGLRVGFSTAEGPVEVLGGIDLALAPGERLAVVGESGSGKSVTARAVLGLLPPRRTRIAGSIRFAGKELVGHRRRVEALRGREITMIFQDPAAALNPSFTVRQQFLAVLARRGRTGRAAAERRMHEVLAEVAVPDPGRVLGAYPFQLSGGLNQRVVIALALANLPRLVIADEPGTALDVTVQEQTLRIMRQLSEAHGTAILFISHNLGVVLRFAHRVCVMYAGTIVEQAQVGALFARPRHPYTRALLASVPRLSRRAIPEGIPGAVPDFRTAITGCPFRPRCAVAMPRCAAPVPMAEAAAGHYVACVHASAFDAVPELTA